MLRHKNVFLFILVLLLIALPYFLLPGREFTGTDDLAGEAISELAPAYEPWFQPLWEPGNGVTEKFIFTLQAVLGGAAIGYYLWTKKRKQCKSE